MKKEGYVTLHGSTKVNSHDYIGVGNCGTKVVCAHWTKHKRGVAADGFTYFARVSFKTRHGKAITKTVRTGAAATSCCN